MSSFETAVKSTLDKKIKDLAQANGYDFVDLDGSFLFGDLMESQSSALAWSLITLVGAPRRPLWALVFEAGGKTSYDPAQYVSMDIVSLVTHAFEPGSSFDVMDYSGASGSPAPTVKMGEIIITDCGVRPAQFDRVAGLRLVLVEASILEF